MNVSGAAGTHRVFALVRELVIPIELAIPSAIFSRASCVRRAAYSFRVCTANPGAIATADGYAITVPDSLAALATADTIIIPGTAGGGSAAEGGAGVALRSARQRGARIAAISSSVFVLGSAGLLDGRRATTSWNRLAQLASRFPAAAVDLASFVVEDTGIFTCEGAAAAIDLCLYLVRCDNGAECASDVARACFGPQRTNGAADVSAESWAGGAPSLDNTRMWMLDNLRKPITVHDMAAHANMSARNFARRFVDEHGTTPVQWLLDKRMLVAQQLLNTTSLSIKEIAARSGFGSTTSLRDQFKRRTGLTPLAYRDAAIRTQVCRAPLCGCN